MHRLDFRKIMEAVAITLRVPATSANLGAGFDCLGLALDVFASITVTFSSCEQPPTEDVGEKMVLTAVRLAYQRMGRESRRDSAARYNLAIPLGRGMGASAVARVAGILAANEREGHPLDDETVLTLASELEGHGDNACPALYGGMQVCVNHEGRYLRAPCRFPSDATDRDAHPGPFDGDEGGAQGAPRDLFQGRRRAQHRAGPRSSSQRWLPAGWTSSTPRPTTGSTSASEPSSFRRCSTSSRPRKARAPTRPG